jgi:hypothetical protein
MPCGLRQDSPLGEFMHDTLRGVPNQKTRRSKLNRRKGIQVALVGMDD